MIAEALRHRIESQQLCEGDRFPTERELVDEFSVARMTVRHALDQLQLEGLIERRRGRTGGTFVAVTLPEIELSSTLSLYEQLRRSGHELDLVTHSLRLIPCPRHAVPRLGVEPQEQVWELTALVMLDREPVAHSLRLIPRHLYPELDQQPNPGAHVDAAHKPCKRDTVSPFLPTAAARKLLKVTPKQALLRLERIVSEPTGEIVEYAEHTVRTDKVRCVTSS